MQLNSHYSAFNRRIGDKWKVASGLEFHTTEPQLVLEKDSDRRSLMSSWRWYQRVENRQTSLSNVHEGLERN